MNSWENYQINKVDFLKSQKEEAKSFTLYS